VGAQGLCFLAEDGRALLVNSDGLGQVIRAAGDSIRLVVLNACYSRVQAEALVAHVSCVIGMPSAIGDGSAIVYAAELYRALAFGKSVANAHQCGLAALAIHPSDSDMRDIDVAETVLRKAPPELLVRTGVDAGRVHIVQGAPPTSAVPASSGESRIHLEIDIDGDFEALDTSTLGKLVSEIRRLSGGRPVRILCVTKGSIRLHLSFEPEAAKALVSLRDSGGLDRLGDFRVTNVVDLGQVTISAQAREQADVLQRPSHLLIQIEDLGITTGSNRGLASAASQSIVRPRAGRRWPLVAASAALVAIGASVLTLTRVVAPHDVQPAGVVALSPPSPLILPRPPPAAHAASSPRDASSQQVGVGRPDVKRPAPRRARVDSKEPSWNDDSPFMPVQTPPRDSNTPVVTTDVAQPFDAPQLSNAPQPSDGPKQPSDGPKPQLDASVLQPSSRSTPIRRPVAAIDDKDAKNAPAIAKQAKALEDARKWEDARAAYQRLEKFKPYRSEAMYGQAYAAFQTSDAHMAEQIAGQLATKGGPYRIKAMFLYADALYVQAQYARAKVIYQKLRTELHGEQRASAQKKIIACNKGLNLPENSGID
jgi:hypothetical protein